MKFSFYLIIAILFQSTLHSQENEETPYRRDYLGIYNGKPTYCTGFSHVFSNEVSLFNIQDGKVFRIETFGLPDDIFEQVFLFNNRVYGLVTDRKKTTYYLIKFDKAFNIEERITIMPYSDRINKQSVHVHITPELHSLKIISRPGKLLLHLQTDKMRLAVVDFESMKSKCYTLNTSFSFNFDTQDALFFNETDAHVVLQNGIYTTKYQYVTLIDGQINTMDLNEDRERNEEGKAAQFKFIQANGLNYLVSLLYKGTKLIGHTVTEIEDASISNLSLHKVINEKLSDPSILGNQKAIRGRGIGNVVESYRYPALDEVLFLNNQLIFSIRFYPSKENISNILISSLNINDSENPTVNWNIITRNGQFNDSQYRYNQYTHGYALSVINEETIRIYYDCDKATINENGEVLKKKKESKKPAKKRALAIMQINLTDATISYLKNPYFDLPKIVVNIYQPLFAQEGNYIYFLMEESRGRTPGTKIKDLIYNYKPTVYKFPIDYEQVSDF